MFALWTGSWKLDQGLQERKRMCWHPSIWYLSTILLTNLCSQKAGLRLSQGSGRYGPGIFVIQFTHRRSDTHLLCFRDNLLERTRLLQKRQRSEHIALPTTLYTPLSVRSNSSVLGGKERAPCMQVPEFTPLRCRAAPPRKS